MALRLEEKTITLESGITLTLQPNGVIVSSTGKTFSPADGVKYTPAFRRMTGGRYNDTYDKKYGYIQMPDGSTHFIDKGASDLSGAKAATGTDIFTKVFEGKLPPAPAPAPAAVAAPVAAPAVEAPVTATAEETPPPPPPDWDENIKRRATTEEAENIRGLGRTTRAQAGRVLGAFLTGTPINQAISGIQPESIQDKQYKAQLVKSIQALRESNERLQRAGGENRVRAMQDAQKAQNDMSKVLMQGRSGENTAKITQMGQAMRILRQEEVVQASKKETTTLSDDQQVQKNQIINRLSGAHDPNVSGYAATRQAAVDFVHGISAAQDTAAVVPAILNEYRHALGGSEKYDAYFLGEQGSKSHMEEADARGKAALARVETAVSLAQQRADDAERKMMGIYGPGKTWAYKHQDAQANPESPFAAEVKLLDDPQIAALEAELTAKPTGFRTRAMELQKIAKSQGYQDWLAENPEVAGPESGVTERRKLKKYIRETKKELGPQRRKALKGIAPDTGETPVVPETPPVDVDVAAAEDGAPAVASSPAADDTNAEAAQQEQMTGLQRLGQQATKRLVEIYKNLGNAPIKTPKDVWP